MKLFVGLVLLAVVGCVYSNNCNIVGERVTQNFPDKCSKELVGQIKMEVEASYAYLQFGAYFSKDNVNLPGFAELFFKAAKEERDHAIKLMDYLSMRLAEDNLVTSLEDFVAMKPKEISTVNGSVGAYALNEALNMEKRVTANIQKVIGACDNAVTGKAANKEYHASDYLTGDFLTEQYESERSFAGQLATLKKMIKSHGSLAEFLFDKNL